MITQESFSKEWILSQSKTIGKADPNLVELMIHAFSLLEKLVVNKLDFVFKGGTALLLLLPELKRFSTDIDILCTVEKKDIESILDKICTDSVFSRWELDNRRSYQPGIPKAHYKLFFTSDIDGKEKELMLDILFETPDYPELVEKEIKLKWLKSDGIQLLVTIPSVDAILGDKLCAFGPNTVGVPYNAGKEREIVKQLFDINMLFPQISNIDIVAQSFKTIAAKEISYRENNIITIKDIFADIRNTAFMMAYGYREKFESDENRKKYYDIESGRAALKSFIVGTTMLSKELILLAAAQAAYITSLIEYEKTTLFSLFNEKQDPAKYLFAEPPESMLNRLLKLQGGILYYLKSVHDLIK
jgi:predicted nucleotidyltransferase component of viral defense system